MEKKYVPYKGLGTCPRLVVFSCKNLYFIVLPFLYGVGLHSACILPNGYHAMSNS